MKYLFIVKNSGNMYGDMYQIHVVSLILNWLVIWGNLIFPSLHVWPLKIDDNNNFGFRNPKWVNMYGVLCKWSI